MSGKRDLTKKLIGKGKIEMLVEQHHYRIVSVRPMSTVKNCSLILYHLSFEGIGMLFINYNNKSRSGNSLTISSGPMLFYNNYPKKTCHPHNRHHHHHHQWRR